MDTSILDNTKMYRLPYSKNDNPNAWIEVTTYCNMKCAGCYKGIDRDDNVKNHKALNELKEEIVELKRIRNNAILTISGGEALMHPEIIEIVKFANELGLKSFIHTNGILVKKDIITKLKIAGLCGLIIRIDTNNRNQFEFEDDLNELRQSYAELINSIGGLQLGFTYVVTKSNLEQTSKIVKWFQNNHIYADYLVLILKREFRFKSSEEIDYNQEVTIEQLCKHLKSGFPDMIFSSYLGSQLHNVGFKWVNSAWISYNRKILSYNDAKMIEVFTAYQHLKNGNYSYVAGKGRNYISILQMLGAVFMLKSMRKVMRRYIIQIIKLPRLITTLPNSQVINIVNPPSSSSVSFDYCDSCPDAVLHNGKLTPSCTLESIKKSSQNE